ncbi:hypothetical protein ASPSYDRAFT_159846 [Aspergillus sydowii CBS 593.65]|uniref:Uncharacterized protein n=1 Tax=Aspergillus sydowii CBS 593.65 TaxID=1036612 RepID=A0A1L9T5V3_9EURO|nr:uncharacterized protein ASPSYDRAFT_159846 [Aspergillus sydowii CBS 593.65]OJJ54778.1 hypothetical protein ASPSYDRAFT_159846 [Aspergillus sydowii CBS 593.65]
MTLKILEHFEMEAREIFLAASKANSCFGGRWVVMLSSSATGLYDVYYSAGSPSIENGYERKEVLDLKTEGRSDLFTKSIFLGCFQMERLNRFINVFQGTTPGPDQFFAVRLIHGLVEECLIEQLMVRQILWEPRYSEEERKYYEDNLSPVDYLFYATDVKDSGHLVPEKSGRKFPYFYRGCTSKQ